MKGTLAFFMGPLLQNNKLPLKIALLSHFVADVQMFAATCKYIG